MVYTANNGGGISLKDNEIIDNVAEANESTPIVETNQVYDSAISIQTTLQNLFPHLYPKPQESLESIESVNDVIESEPTTYGDCKSLSMTDLEIQLYLMDKWFKERELAEKMLPALIVLIQSTQQAIQELTTNSDGTTHIIQKARVSKIYQNTNMSELVDEHGTFEQKAMKEANKQIWSIRAWLDKWSKWIIGLSVFFGVVIGVFVAYNYFKSYASAKGLQAGKGKGFISKMINK